MQEKKTPPPKKLNKPKKKEKRLTMIPLREKKKQVTAGIDLIYEFIKQKYPNGTALTKRFGEVTEYEPETDWRADPWSERFNVTVPVPEPLV